MNAHIINKAREIVAVMPKRMDQKDVARLMGCTPQNVHYYEVHAIAKIVAAFWHEASVELTAN